MAVADTTSSAALIPDQESIIALANRAREEKSAIDELAVAFALTADAARDLRRHSEYLERQNLRLEQRLATLIARLYGQSSEKIDPDQLRLFLAAHFPGTPTSFVEEKASEGGEKRKPRAKGHGRDTFPPHVPRNVITLEPESEDCVCATCQEKLTRIRDEVTERGDFVPGYWSVNRYVRGVWVCRKGCGGVVMADLPKTLVDKSRFEPSVAVHTAIAKFADHLPLHRQEQMHDRFGVSASASTLGDNTAELGKLHAPTVEQMRQEVAAESVVHADDTPVKALVDRPVAEGGESAPAAKEKDKKKTRIEVRQWVYVAAAVGKIFFAFTKTRGHEGPLAALAGFEGHLVTDGYQGFNEVVRRNGITRCGCWAHVRRKFRDALKEDQARAAWALRLIGRLFRLEAAVKKRRERDPPFDDDDLLALRRRRSRPLLEKSKTYLESISPSVLPEGALGGAVGYALNQWETLVAFVDAPKVPIHNNAAENALRTVAIGRKNYLFYGSLNGGQTAAVFYSLIGSCKALGLDPYAYLRETTATLLADPTTPRERVTPWAWARSRGQRIAPDFNETESDPFAR